jgi:ABC-2 type transport system ATP-binding protein
MDGEKLNMPDTEEISDMKIVGSTAEFIFRGDCNRLVAQLAQYKLMNLEISEPDLEEIFMHYYQ